MLKSRRVALLAAACSTGLILGASAWGAHAETLAEAIAMAYDSNPTLQAQRATQRALDENYVQARTGWRPTITLQGTATNSETRTPGGVRTTFTTIYGPQIGETASTSLTINQPLYTGGRVAASVSAAEADILAGRENLRRVESQVIANVITAYVDVRRDIEALRIREENVNVLSRQLDESRARFDVGEITRTDVAQSQARLAAARALLTQSQAQLAISRANYAAIVGQNPGDLAPEPALSNLLPADVDQAFTAAEQNNAQIRAAEFAAQASRARVAGARAERMPRLDLQGRASFGSGDEGRGEFEDYSRELVAGATVTVPLFTGGLNNSRVRQAIERNNADRINVEGARRTVLQGLTQAWNQLTAARANITSTEEQVAAARIAQEGTRQEQQVGLRTTIDVLNAEQELRQAELSQVTARRDEYVAASLVLNSMGRLEARYLTPNVPQYDAKANFNGLRMTWGWVPWEEPIAILDSALTPQPAEKPITTPQPAATAPAT